MIQRTQYKSPRVGEDVGKLTWTITYSVLKTLRILLKILQTLKLWPKLKQGGVAVVWIT